MSLQTRASIGELAELFTRWSKMSFLGESVITPKRVRSWYLRRNVSGFPEPLPDKEPRGRYRPVQVWDISEVLPWFLEYEPAVGGPPRGNQNGYKHGKYAGEYAEKSARRHHAAHSQED